MAGRVTMTRDVPFVRSLRFRAIVAVVAAMLLPLALIALSAREERTVTARIRGHVQSAALELASVTDPSSLAENADVIATKHGVRARVVRDGRTIVDANHERGGRIWQRVERFLFAADGAPTLDAFDQTLGPLGERPEVRAALSGQQVVDCRTSNGDKLLVCHAALPSTMGVVYVQESSRRPVRAIYDLRYQLVKLALILLPVALLLAWWLGARTVRPIEQLRRQVLAKSENGLVHADLALPGRDEIGDLASTFNALLAAVEEKRRGNEAFVADLVHELKNPLAVVRASADALENAPIDDEKARRLARILRAGTCRLDRLATQFLELARAEAGMPNETRERIDLSELARGVVASTDAPIEIDARSPCAIDGVASRIETVVRNLVDNAVAFAGPTGTIRVCVRSEDDDAVLSVTDDGPGIPKDDLDRIFVRFFTTRGREAHPGNAGTGLGLSLVRAIVEGHGGAARARSEGHGAELEVRLPLARSHGVHTRSIDVSHG